MSDCDPLLVKKPTVLIKSAKVLIVPFRVVPMVHFQCTQERCGHYVASYLMQVCDSIGSLFLHITVVMLRSEHIADIMSG